MGILGIDNRTENWKTVRKFYSLTSQGRRELVDLLLDEGEPRPGPEEKIEMELFWHGIRDHMDQKGRKIKDLVDEFQKRYQWHFKSLRDEVKNFRANEHPYKFADLEDHNYDGNHKYLTGRKTDKLSENLTNTEIDIVLATSDYLFIGEAKHESELGTNANLVLVHQLIRQFVMVKVLLDLREESLKVVPFLVVDSAKLASHLNTIQVKFMVNTGRLRRENVLCWDDIAKLNGVRETVP